jgi:hypothetical protein
MVFVNVLFLHRLVYRMQQEKIDKALATAYGLFEKYSKLVVGLIPKYVEAVKKN